MGVSEEAVVRRFYEEMNTGRKLEIAGELFTDDHVLHDPQVPGGTGPQAMAEVISVYQQGADGVWTIEEIFSAGDRVVVRWTGTGTHVGEINGVPATGNPDPRRWDHHPPHERREDRRNLAGLGHPEPPAADRGDPGRLTCATTLHRLRATLPRRRRYFSSISWIFEPVGAAEFDGVLGGVEELIMPGQPAISPHTWFRIGPRPAAIPSEGPRRGCRSCHRTCWSCGRVRGSA